MPDLKVLPSLSFWQIMGVSVIEFIDALFETYNSDIKNRA